MSFQIILCTVFLFKVSIQVKLLQWDSSLNERPNITFSTDVLIILDQNVDSHLMTPYFQFSSHISNCAPRCKKGFSYTYIDECSPPPGSRAPLSCVCFYYQFMFNSNSQCYIRPKPIVNGISLLLSSFPIMFSCLLIYQPARPVEGEVLTLTWFMSMCLLSQGW